MQPTPPIERIAHRLDAVSGLVGAEIEDARRRHGANHIVEARAHPALEIARSTAADPMIWFLIGTAVLYALLGQRSEAITLVASILPLVAMDFYLHRRSQASTRALAGLLADTARVIRGGTTATIPATDVVVGDLVEIGAGEPFPADGLIVAARGVTVDESALTGESLPIDKRALPAARTGDAAVRAMDAASCGYAGTRVLTGTARLRVAAVGSETLYGAIVRLALGVTRARTPLQRSVSALVSGLLVAAVVLCAVLALARLHQGYGWIDAVISAASLAVAALPEEFPVVLTVFLGVGVYRLARRRALVNRAVAVENIGRVSCICTDKTGTITLGQLRVTRVVAAPGFDDARVLAIAAGAARRETGDPLDQAILDAAGTEPADGLATFPFTEDRRRETVVIAAPDGVGAIAMTKGAPETVLALCGGVDRAAWTARVDEQAATGAKVVACAWRALTSYAGGEPDRDLEFAGLIALADPLRPGVADAVAWCRDSGLRVLVITGDHPATARAIARDMGLAAEPVVITGEALAGNDIAAVIRGADVVARAMPADKLAIVRALQHAGETVAVTGDGVNDVPALQAADVGIAMGQHGARSAREVSSIVLLDDNFHSIVAAIAEGRALFENLRLSFQYLLMFHLPLVLTGTFVPVAGYPVLYLPIHIVWLEAVIHPTALLAFQGSSTGVPSRRRSRDGRLFARGEWATIAVVGVLVTALVSITYSRSLGPAGDDVAHARAMALVMLIAAGAAMTASTSGLRTAAARVIVAMSLASAVVLVQVQPLAELIHVKPLHLDDWLLAVGGAFAAVVPVVFAARPRPDRRRRPDAAR